MHERSPEEKTKIITEAEAVLRELKSLSMRVAGAHNLSEDRKIEFATNVAHFTARINMLLDVYKRFDNSPAWVAATETLGLVIKTHKEVLMARGQRLNGDETQDYTDRFVLLERLDTLIGPNDYPPRSPKGTLDHMV